ncbi:MAG: class I SAM-dependent methyltransferase [Propionibacteriaceae bacterium]|nr:class I SAM-dependent methyltransferase [Propionibacteriaceae bacterium]
MSHYFLTPEGTPDSREVRTTIWGRDYVLTSADGVFSATRLDPGTAVLFRLTDPPDDREACFLDLGCGFGPIAIALAVECPHALVDAVDVNQRALDLTAGNAVRLGIDDRVRALRPQDVPDDTTYDEIWSNPPIRIGKQALHELLDTWLPRLAPTGQAHLVVSKNLGADSLHSWLQDRGWMVTRLGSAKGFRVLGVTHSPDSCQPTR